MTLEVYRDALARALEPLGIEVGSEVLDIWRDRMRRGQDPIPPHTLELLEATVQHLLLLRTTAAATNRE